jgi:3-oxoadipate enol-lactonase
MMLGMHGAREGFTAGQTPIHYWQLGDRGPKVLLLMGFGMRGSLWRPQIEGLKNGHQLAWLDNRGIGKSGPCPTRTWTMADMARDSLDVADALGWERFHLVGVSMGGMVSQEVALLSPARILSLSLLATHEGGNPLRWAPRAKGLRCFLEAQTRRDGERVAALRKLLYPEAYVAQCDMSALEARMTAQVGTPAPREALLGQLSAVIRHKTGPRLHRLRMPTLIVKPTLDILIPPSNSDRLRRRIPHATFIELDDAGHGAIFQRADTINDALRTHFQDAAVSDMATRGSNVHA